MPFGYLTSDEAAARLGITRRTLYNHMRHTEGFPQPRKAGRALLWTPKALDKWREKHPARKKPPASESDTPAE